MKNLEALVKTIRDRKNKEVDNKALNNKVLSNSTVDNKSNKESNRGFFKNIFSFSN